MKKRDIRFFTVFLATPMIVSIIFAALYCFKLTESSWVVLVTTCTSSTCTLILGLSVFFQTENHKKRAEEDETKHQEEEKQNRIQDLKIKANPVVFLNGIKRFEFDTLSNAVTLTQAKNNLSTETPKERFNIFSSLFSIDLSFSNPAQRMLDYITIEKSSISCDKGSFTDSDYEHKFGLELINFSKEKSNVKIESDGQYISLLQLYAKEIDENCEDLIELLNDPTNRWSLNISYVLSNSCKVYVKFQSQIIFTIKDVLSRDFVNKCKVSIEDIVTWQRSELCVEE